jgi:hypothetical protein
MANVGNLTVEMILASAKFQADLGKAAQEAVTAANKIEKAVREQTKQVDEGTAKLKEWGRALIGAFGISLGVEGIIRGFEAVKDKAIEGERSISNLRATLQATGQAAGLTFSQLEHLNTELAGQDRLRRRRHSASGGVAAALPHHPGRRIQGSPASRSRRCDRTRHRSSWCCSGARSRAH